MHVSMSQGVASSNATAVLPEHILHTIACDRPRSHLKRVIPSIWICFARAFAAFLASGAVGAARKASNSGGMESIAGIWFAILNEGQFLGFSGG